jgi:hypothetical protein
MAERARVRCPSCRTAVSLTMLWATGDTCPTCSRPLRTARPRPEPAGVLGRTLALVRAETRTNPPAHGSPR